MKIIAGLSNAITKDEIESYIRAGADEFFVGYIPYEWLSQYGWEICNRRSSPNDNYSSIDELADIVEIVHSKGKKILLCLNEHEYSLKQINLLMKILKNINTVPFDAYIVSNLSLMLQLRKSGFNNTINLSIGAGCNNISSILFYKKNISNIGRVILPRWLTIEEIENIAKECNDHEIKLEVFGAAGPCIFNDEYCFSWHSAETGPFCASKVFKHKNVNPILTDKDWKKEIKNDILADYLQKKLKLNNILSKDQQIRLKSSKEEIEKYKTNKEILVRDFWLRRNLIRCGLCALNKFKEWGIEAVKIPFRGTNISLLDKLEVIKLVNNIIIKNNATLEFCQSLVGSPIFCSGDHCYYNYPPGKEIKL
ncbi:MAG: U32 family peptidase [Spirochaetes bacterium]|nr:U32 family peptidase [Spirochaetota bacterium]